MIKAVLSLPVNGLQDWINMRALTSIISPMNLRISITSWLLKLDEPTRPRESFPDWLLRAQAPYEMIWQVLVLTAALRFCLDGTACVDIVAGIVAAAKTIQLALLICLGPDTEFQQWMVARWLPWHHTVLAIMASIVISKQVGGESEASSCSTTRLTS